ncbi:MAG: peptidylprolyl isomerase [Nocardioidaceae bacterium]|nr:peptidylprolyl isomerase [Nocardioidaceae bacterium]
MLPARRLALVPALLSVCALFLTACGNNSSSDDPFIGGKSYDRLDAVTISGDVGSEPVVKWKGSMTAGKVETKTLIEGDGEALKGQDDVLAHLWIGNGYSQQTALSTYADKKAELLTVNNQLPEFLAGIRDAKLGSRIAVTASAKEAFGEQGNSGLGIANKDTVLFIIDLVSKVQDKPEGEQSAYPAWMPTPKFTKGVITGFDFTNAPAPTADLRRVQLIKGTGPRVKKGQTIAVRYLGEAFGGDKPFDENFGDTGTGKPTTFGIGLGQVIKGWDKALNGVPVGSRVVLEIPPELGYGAEGSPDSGIPKNATLVFMIDILAAA